MTSAFCRCFRLLCRFVRKALAANRSVLFNGHTATTVTREDAGRARKAVEPVVSQINKVLTGMGIPLKHEGTNFDQAVMDTISDFLANCTEPLITQYGDRVATMVSNIFMLLQFDEMPGATDRVVDIMQGTIQSGVMYGGGKVSANLVADGRLNLYLSTGNPTTDELRTRTNQLGEWLWSEGVRKLPDGTTDVGVAVRLIFESEALKQLGAALIDTVTNGQAHRKTRMGNALIVPMPPFKPARDTNELVKEFLDACLGSLVSGLRTNGIVTEVLLYHDSVTLHRDMLRALEQQQFDMRNALKMVEGLGGSLGSRIACAVFGAAESEDFQPRPRLRVTVRLLSDDARAAVGLTPSMPVNSPGALAITSPSNGSRLTLTRAATVTYADQLLGAGMAALATMRARNSFPTCAMAWAHTDEGRGATVRMVEAAAGFVLRWSASTTTTLGDRVKVVPYAMRYQVPLPLFLRYSSFLVQRSGSSWSVRSGKDIRVLNQMCCRRTLFFMPSTGTVNVSQLKYADVIMPAASELRISLCSALLDPNGKCPMESIRVANVASAVTSAPDHGPGTGANTSAWRALHSVEALAVGQCGSDRAISAYTAQLYNRVEAEVLLRRAASTQPARTFVNVADSVHGGVVLNVPDGIAVPASAMRDVHSLLEWMTMDPAGIAAYAVLSDPQKLVAKLGEMYGTAGGGGSASPSNPSTTAAQRRHRREVAAQQDQEPGVVPEPRRSLTFGTSFGGADDSVE